MECVGCEQQWRENAPINLARAKQTLIDQFTVCWKEEIACKSKLKLYSHLKTQWGLEPYIKVNLDKEKCSLLCGVRTGSLPLMVETGRFQNLPRHQRICKLCDGGNVENELHFLFGCKTLENIRINLYYEHPELLNYCTDVDKCTFLFAKPYIVGNYVKKLWQVRENVLNEVSK